MSEAKAQHYRQHPANEGNPDNPDNAPVASEQITPQDISTAAAFQRFRARHGDDQGEVPNEPPA